MKNIKQVRDELIKQYEVYKKSSKSDKDLDELAVITKVTSAIIRSAKTELDYKKYTNDKKIISFLKT